MVGTAGPFTGFAGSTRCICCLTWWLGRVGAGGQSPRSRKDADEDHPLRASLPRFETVASSAGPGPDLAGGAWGGMLWVQPLKPGAPEPRSRQRSRWPLQCGPLVAIISKERVFQVTFL